MAEFSFTSWLALVTYMIKPYTRTKGNIIIESIPLCVSMLWRFQDISTAYRWVKLGSKRMEEEDIQQGWWWMLVFVCSGKKQLWRQYVWTPTNQLAWLFRTISSTRTVENKHIFSNQRSEIIASQNNDPGHPSQEQRRFDSVLWKTPRANSMPRWLLLLWNKSSRNRFVGIRKMKTVRCECFGLWGLSTVAFTFYLWALVHVRISVLWRNSPSELINMNQNHWTSNLKRNTCSEHSECPLA